MTNMNTTFPFLKIGKFHESSPVARVYIEEAEKTINFSLKNGRKYFEISSLGILHFNKDLIRENNKIALDKIGAEITAKDSLSTVVTSLEMNLLPLNSLDCDLFVEDICFWTSVKYRIKENRPPTILGTLANPYLVEMCPNYKINYTLKDELNILILTPPSENRTAWSLQTSKSLDREEPPSIAPIMALCVIENPQGTIREIIRNITVEVLDVDDNLPVPQEEESHISMPQNMIHKGHRVDHYIIFQDEDSMDVNLHEVRIRNDKLRMLKAICEDRRLDQKFQRTMVLCKLEFIKDVHFGNVTYSVQLELMDKNYEGKNKAVKVPIIIHFNNGSRPIPAAYTFFTRDLILYPNREVKIFRTAGPFARVTQPTANFPKHLTNFTIKQNQKKIIFNVTQTEGIIFVQDHIALAKAKEYVTLNVSWTQDGGRQNYDEIQVRLIDEPTEFCKNTYSWTFCSEFDNIESCTHQNVCSIATGGYNAIFMRNNNGYHRCEWRGSAIPSKKITPLYSTCTPDAITCPNGICDSLENLNDSICPQDCSANIVFPTSRNPKTARGIDQASGVCICTQLGSCHCEVPRKKKKLHASTQTTPLNVPHIINRTLTNDTASIGNVTISGLFGHVSKCGTFCIIGLVAGIFVVGAVVAFIVLCWRLHAVHKAVHEKFGNRNQDNMTAPLSEYSRSDANDLNLPIHFDMTTSLIDKNFINLLKKYEPDPKWEFPRTQLEIEQTLGEGEFGRVLRAKATNINGQSGISTVAVKTLKDDARETELNDLLSEYQLLKEVSHPNVIRLLGVCTTPGGPIYMIIEYAELGSLRNYLRRSRNIRISQIAHTPDEQEARTSHYDEPKVIQITPKEILSFAWQICNGMAYLSSVKLVHRDLAARNILLATDKVCKISDFGLTRDIYEDNAYFKRSKGRVPVKWMAPESLQDHIYTTKSDVWSFGILLWELVTLGASPYPGIAVQNLFHLLKQGYRMERPNNCSTKLYQMMRNCWELIPEKRPPFHEMAPVLEKMLGDGIEYMDLSDNAIQNKSYFMSPFEDMEDEPNSNVNYLNKCTTQKKCGGTEKFLPQVVDAMEKNLDDLDNKNTSNSQQGYETPVKIPRVVKTPSNENPQYYTDMDKGQNRAE
ncbi:hypothetical protein HHI36_009333 [Cryptolaemus montrouzieri]|uniref:Protein kinase domain-containing protein n=1 Tax=Cryptolaemus montrouzieri TaxID=559131 RepID=A0ABD2MVZ1_9CUCU